jgi:8-oxo-dGTP diphosphatase
MDKKEMFSIRVYGIVINNNHEVLVTDEFHFNRRMTKFPGGGLEYGEGTIDCLKREFREELNQEPFGIEHLYTTDFYQPTALVDPPKQLISIYYMAKVPFPEELTTSSIPFNEVNGTVTFRWIPLFQLQPDDLTFPIDRIVAARISGMFR